MDMTKDIIDFTQKLEAAAALKSLENANLINSNNRTSIDCMPKMLHRDVTELQRAKTPKNINTMTQQMRSLTPNATSPTPPPPSTTLIKETADAYSIMPAIENEVTDKVTEHMTSLSSPSSLNGTIATTGDLTPPPRPLTSSEAIGLRHESDELELRIDFPLNKSRSLPASPQHLSVASVARFFDMRDSPLNASAFLERPKAAAVMPAAISRSLNAKASVKPTVAPTTSQQFCLRWNNYQSNLTNVFDELLQNETFVDVTLACEGQSIKAHKMVLSACSPYFQALFYDNPCRHPIVIMRDVRWQELKAIMEFMYKGEINVSQDQINPLLKVAEMLKIRGLAEVSSGTSTSSLDALPRVLPEQRMTVYDDDDDELAERGHHAMHANSNIQDDDENELDACHKAKRARTTFDKLPSGIDLNLNHHNHHKRKRSRDGLLIDKPYVEREQHSSRSSTPQIPITRRDGEVITIESITTNEKNANNSKTEDTPHALTTSTIVRNPFASPNAANNDGNTLQFENNGAENSGALSSSASYRSPPPLSALVHSNETALQSPPSSSVVSISKSNANHHISTHAATHANTMAAAAAAAALVNSHHSHQAAAQAAQAAHHHQRQAAAVAAHQLAAQHQLHAAAHSHAAMATALSASLAATAAAGNSGSGRGSDSGSNSRIETNPSSISHHDDMEIKPEIAEMIREEERAKMIESGGSGHPWMGSATTSSVADSYQYQLQSMWQKCWNTNQQNLVQQLRFRERGPLKSWRPEAMAEAIFSVLKEGLSLSQAARKYDIPYPTFVLYANRVHNMLGPSLDGGTDPRPKARGRPQRILLGMWPEELIRSVIKAVVFRDYREIKEEMGHAAAAYANGQAAVHAQSAFGTASNPTAANGYHNAVKLAAQSAALAPSGSPSPLSTMTETLRRQIMSQQQASPIAQSMNMYKSPAYLQRSEIEEQVTASFKQQSERRASDKLPDLSALGLMGIPGLNVLPSTQAQRGNQLHQQNATNYARELERERERVELTEAIQARQFSNQSCGSTAIVINTKTGQTTPGPIGTAPPNNITVSTANSSSSSTSSSSSSATSSASASTAAAAAAAAAAFTHFKNNKEHPSYAAYNKRFLDNLPPGIDFEAIANGLLQKSVNKSPRFEDFFAAQDMNELLGNAEAAAAAAAAQNISNTTSSATSSANNAHYAQQLCVSPIMKIKLEKQPSEMPHED